MISNISKTLSKIKENSAQVVVEEESSFGSNSDDYLQLAEALKSSNTVEKFHLSSNWKKITNSGLQAISEGLIAQQSLNDLKINLKGALEITDDGLLPLGKAFQSLSSLEKVYLGILQCGSLTEAGVCGVIENLKPSLKSLYITSDIFTDAEFPKLAQLLKAFQTLQSLELDLYSETTQLTNTAIENLKDLSTLTSLTNFAFTISSEQITDPSLQTIAQVVKNLTSLKSLSVDFNDCINLGNAAVQDLGQSLKALSSLEKLVLNFSYCSSLTDHALESLSQAIQTLSSLKSLDLSFASCGGMTDAGFQSLSEGLNKHPSLENVTLNFTNCYLTDAGLQTISRALPTIASLQKTELNLGRCAKLTDAGLVSLTEPLEKLENLKDLSLGFYAGFNLTDSGLHPVIKSIGKLTSIKSVSLDFTASQTSETPFKDVSDAWKNLASLEKLTLWFTSCQKANDATLLDLSNFVEKLTSLKEITLGFDSCNQITGSGIQALSHSLGKLSGLKDVTLGFLGCTLNDAGFEKIGQELEGLKSVEKLSVNFSRCNDLTDQTLEELTKACKKLGSLKVVKANFAMNTGFTDEGRNKILEGEETFEKIITF